ncbi:hypothetical protein [Caballeronia sp. GACF4]|uniref:hypothetical protein n=1 Tax=Caballeronia sp. GACF4 TaxID=2921763 RepID=UPI002027AE37|nr:hypothetical protein [Caballeronia sp. GACF4]
MHDHEPESRDLSPRTYGELIEFATYVANSGLAPKDHRGKPEACAVAMQWGNELGLKPVQSLQNIAVIGKPRLPRLSRRSTTQRMPMP